MFYSDGYTIKDIANIMKLNENTVKTKIDRSRKKIKKSLGGKVWYEWRFWQTIKKTIWLYDH